MNKFAVAICVFFVAVCVVEARQCTSRIGGVLYTKICDNQCCGIRLECADSCKNYECVTDGHCGGGKCKDGKCSTGSVKTVSTTIGIVVLAAVLLSL